MAGYADSEGGQNADVVRNHIYRYRDYVVQAFAADKRRPGIPGVVIPGAVNLVDGAEQLLQSVRFHR
ncbi:MAG: hypothetical protein MJA29_04860 [Candidatus Omnitrophica bacterium]|nr:hypothetical protein [Candidatus Omnitrophota bacterium]